jgi:Sedlin, N-terminal conserved region
MSLLGIAIIGKSNEPLYLCDCTRLLDDEDGDNSATKAADSLPTTERRSGDAIDADFGADNDNEDEDLFGFVEATALLGQRQSLPLERQFMMHAALDRLEELIGVSKPDGTMPLRPATHHHRNSSSGSASNTPLLLSPNNAHWLGLLTVQDGDCAVYGHVVVPTNLKFLALVQVSSSSSAAAAGAPNNNNASPSSPKTAKAVKKLLANLHGNYVDYLMNPFSKIVTPARGGLLLIDSPRFDANVRETVATYKREQEEGK